MAIFRHIPRETELAYAPAANYYIDSEIGEATGLGTLLSPYRSFTSLPSVLPAGTRIAVRNRATPYGRLAADPSYTGVVWAFTANGTAENPVELIPWGSGPAATISGDIPVLTWGPVINSHGNAFLAEHGEQVKLGSWASPFCLHYIGEEVLTPSFWSPASPTPLSSANRWDAVAPYDGSDSFYDTPNAQTQATPPANINPDGNTSTNDSWWPAVDFDTSRRLSFAYGTVYHSADFGSPTTYETIVRLQWPEIYARYGAGPGPIGAVVGMVCNPANGGQWGVVTGYEVIDVGGVPEGRLTVSLGVRSASSGGPVYPTGRWNIMCHPIDLAQEAQTAALYDGAGGLDVWRVKGSWMRGRSSVSGWHKVLNLASGSAFFRVTGPLVVGRQFDKGTSLSYAVAAEGTWDCYWNDLTMRQSWSANFDHMWSPPTSGNEWGRHIFDNVLIEQAFTCGGLRFRGNKGVIVNRFLGRDIGRTALYSSGVNDAEAPTIFRNYTTFHGGTVHGNGRSAYDRATNTYFEFGLNIDRNLNGTHQTDSNFADCPVPRNIRYTNEILMAFRPVQVGGSPQPAAEAMTSDTAMQNCLVDRIFSPVGGEYSSLRIAGTGGTEANGKSNNGLVIKRSVLDGIAMAANTGTAKGVGGVPVTVRDVTSRRGAITAGGGTVLRSEVIANPNAVTTPMMLSDQEYLTRTDDNTTGAAGAHEGTRIGPDWLDWQLPAWNNGADVGAPVQLRLSKLDYDLKQKAGRCCAVALRHRPGSAITLPAGVGDNDLFDLDRGYLVPRVRMAALSYEVTIRETTIHGVVRDTVFTLIARR